jgi:single-strand DNA-binding protein
MDTWDDKQTGQKRTKLRVVGESMQLLGSRPAGAGAAGETTGEDRQTSAGSKTSPPPPKASAPAEPDDDEIPF